MPIVKSFNWNNTVKVFCFIVPTLVMVLVFTLLLALRLYVYSIQVCNTVRLVLHLCHLPFEKYDSHCPISTLQFFIVLMMALVDFCVKMESRCFNSESKEKFSGSLLHLSAVIHCYVLEQIFCQTN